MSSLPSLTHTIFPERTKQTVLGLGFEIQCDSIGSGNQGIPDELVSVPHDLTPSERQRFYQEMLQGFRYCRLAAGLYWRGLDAEKKFMIPRWPSQLEEIREMMECAGLEGISFEYWSPAPFWKANQSYPGIPGEPPARNQLRPFAPGFDQDPIYKGDIELFLSDFANAVVTDLKTLADGGVKTSMWGLQNEPHNANTFYSTCEYIEAADYVKTYRAVASAIREYDSSILLFADTEGWFPKKIGPSMSDPSVAALVDAYAVHTIGADSEVPWEIHAKITEELPQRPWFQNEYEYLTGGATPDRCLNTVQHIMNSFQLAGNPTWFWLHALKPLGNAEASGYALGFWRSLIQPLPPSNEGLRRWPGGPKFTDLPEELLSLEMLNCKRGDPQKPGIEYHFLSNQPVTVYLLAENCGVIALPEIWKKLPLTAAWGDSIDHIYQAHFPAGTIDIPAHTGQQADHFGAPHLLFLLPEDAASFKPEIGINMPLQIHSETLALERQAAAVAPGHWIYNPYNWHAVGSFSKRMPWDSVVIDLCENQYDANGRILAFKKPNGRFTIVLSNRSSCERSFRIATGLPAGRWKGYRYTPEEAGEQTLGVPIGEQTNSHLEAILPPLSWEFWEQQ